MVYPEHLVRLSEHRPDLADEVVRIEEELDRLHAPWRQAGDKAARFDHLPIDYIRRIKWLLKRRELLTFSVAGGIPAPRDWDIQIADSMKNSKMCFAHPVPLQANQTKHGTQAPPSPLAAFRVAS
jgi:hypothetical protein